MESRNAIKRTRSQLSLQCGAWRKTQRARALIRGKRGSRETPLPPLLAVRRYSIRPRAGLFVCLVVGGRYGRPRINDDGLLSRSPSNPVASGQSATISFKADDCSIAAIEPACTLSATPSSESVFKSISTNLNTGATSCVKLCMWGFHLWALSYARSTVSHGLGPPGTPHGAPQ